MPEELKETVVANLLSEEELEGKLQAVDESKRSDVVKSLIKDLGDNFTFPLLKKSLLLTPQSDHDELLRPWFKIPGNNVSFDIFSTEILPLIDEEKYDIAFSYFLQGNAPENNFDFETLIRKALPLLVKTGFGYTLPAWFRKNKLVLQDLIEKALPLLPKDRHHDVLLSYLPSLSSEEQSETLVKIIDDNLLTESKYDFNEIADFFINFYILSNNLIPSLCIGLYQNNESMQAALFEAFLNKNMLNKADDLPMIKEFISNLKEDDVVLKLLKKVQNQLRLEEKDILDIASSRTHGKYQSIYQLLCDAELKNSVTEEGLGKLRRLFGQGYDQIPLNNLFFYYEIKGNVNGFISLLNPEFKDQVKSRFKPTDKYIYISGSEYESFRALTGANLPSVKFLSSYLENEAPPIKRVNEKLIDNCWINFNSPQIAAENLNNPGKLSLEESDESKEESGYSNKEQDPTILAKQEKILAEFKRLLKIEKEELVDSEVTEFFKAVLNIDADINEKNQKKLKELFAENKSELIYLFKIEGTLDRLNSWFYTIGDGCVANIGTQLKNFLFQSLITDPCAQILYPIFCEKIVTPVLNSGGDRLRSSPNGINIFHTDAINNSFIFPNGLVAELKKSLLDTQYNELISSLIGGEEQMEKLIENLQQIMEDQPHDLATFKENNLDIGAYLVLKKTLPEIFDSEYLKEFREHCEKIFPYLEELHYEEKPRGEGRKEYYSSMSGSLLSPSACSLFSPKDFLLSLSTPSASPQNSAAAKFPRQGESPLIII
ncbi:MAG: hypothetical protein K0R25_1107 [Rickettsiaceae bacterium]|jgi:hypothetical protein|nr:hypothetical protein [Rickettsiaceae bacterium]